MKILIDADGCPVVDLTVKLSKNHGCGCIIFCDTAHLIEREGAETVVVSKGADSADFALLNRVEKGDIVVTQDYGLAAMCLSKGAKVINQNGMVYNEQNIDGLLAARHVAKKVRNAGGRLKGPSKRTGAADEAFREALRALLQNQ